MRQREPISNRLQQFALAQLDLALTYLTDPKRNPDAAIHETRRCVKRVRALLRLVKAQLPAINYDRENLYLRNVGRQLTTLRDAAVRVETLAALQKEYAPQLPRSAWRTLKKELGTTLLQPKLSKTKRMAAVATRLHTARTRVEKWALEFDDQAVLQQGVRQAYRRGGRAMARALAEPTAENFHEWRKQVNHLRHQLQILQALQLGKVKATLRDFKALAELLGRKNDLDVLARYFQRHPPTAGKPVSEALQALLHTRDAAFASAASQLGQRLYAHKAKAYTQQIWP